MFVEFYLIGKYIQYTYVYRRSLDYFFFHEASQLSIIKSLEVGDAGYKGKETR